MEHCGTPKCIKWRSDEHPLMLTEFYLSSSDDKKRTAY